MGEYIMVFYLYITQYISMFKKIIKISGMCMKEYKVLTQNIVCLGTSPQGILKYTK